MQADLLAVKACGARLEDVFEALQGHGDDFGVDAVQQVAQRLDAARVHQVFNLHGRPTAFTRPYFQC